jgi:hypothetical protein
VALAVGAFGELSRTVEGVRLGVLATPDRIRYGTYPLGVAGTLLSTLRTYLEIPFPLAMSFASHDHLFPQCPRESTAPAFASDR